MLGQEIINAQYGATDEADSLRTLFVDFALEVDEILPDNDSKRSCIAQLRYALDNAIAAIAEQVEKECKPQSGAASVVDKLDKADEAPKTDYEAYQASKDESAASVQQWGVEAQAPGNVQGA